MNSSGSPLHRVIVVGGTAVIDESVANQLEAITSAPVERIAGADRYATAAAVSQDSYPSGADAVLLVTGDTYPDGLAAGSVAATLGGPVLLTAGNALPPATRSELIRLSPSTVIIVGGTAAIPASVATSVGELGLNVQRVSGPDRYATAMALSSAFMPPSARPVFVATGEAFPDALAGAAAAGHLGGPVLLSRTDSLPISTRQELGRFFPR